MTPTADVPTRTARAWRPGAAHVRRAPRTASAPDMRSGRGRLSMFVFMLFSFFSFFSCSLNPSGATEADRPRTRTPARRHACARRAPRMGRTGPPAAPRWTSPPPHLPLLSLRLLLPLNHAHLAEPAARWSRSCRRCAARCTRRRAAAGRWRWSTAWSTAAAGRGAGSSTMFMFFLCTNTTSLGALLLGSRSLPPTPSPSCRPKRETRRRTSSPVSYPKLSPRPLSRRCGGA